MGQYVPDVTEADVERIVRRDYPPELHAMIFEKIRGIEVREEHRVILACLKNARGDIKKLEGELAWATDFRERISEAEYPNYSKVWFHVERLSPEEVERIIEKDKAQYLKWLHGEGP